MKKFVKLSLAAMAALLLVCPTFTVFAGSHGTEPEAKDLLQKATDHFVKVGEAQALKDFNDPQAGFVDRDLYVFCAGSDNKFSVHPIKKALIGTDLYGLKDADGFLFGKAMIDDSKIKKTGYIDYKWVNKETGLPQAKRAFWQKMSDQVCAVGVYKY